MTGRGALALALGLALASPPALAQQDPRLQWRTLETPHFRIHFYQAMEPLARRVAVIAEHTVERLATPLGWRQSQVTQIVLRDSTDDANGSATAIPLNTLQLFVTAPEDLSVLEQYDDWLENLVIHEYAHILHTDHITGVPAIVNAIIGKQWAPNQVQPRFILEGLAVFQESLHTRGGRLRSATWDSYLRADALAGNFQTLDQLTVGPNRWPHGNLWYLYGSYLMRYVVERYGAETLSALSREYGSMAAPWQLNRAIRRVTGATWEEIYEDFQRDTVARYTRQRDALVANVLEEGTALTAQGEYVRNPRFLPDGTLVYESSDGQSVSRLRALDASVFRSPPGALPTPTDLNRLAGPSGFSPWGDDALLVSDSDVYRHLYFYHDLRRWSLARDDDRSLSVTEDDRLTEGWRAQQPDVHPDGDHAVFTVNHRGTTRLVEMSLTDRRPSALLNPRAYEQVFAPRYSPDGRTVAFSFWRRGGYRDLWTIDRATRALTQHTHDRALDTSPSYSPDGRWLLWSSDRTGIANLYAMEVATGRVRQVTNTVLGAWQPNVSPDGRTLIYLGYSHRGYDLFRLPFDPARWRDPEVVTQDPFGRDRDRDPHPAEDAAPDFPTRLTAYDPWPTLRPRTWSAELTTDGFGPQLAVRTESTDIVGRHAWSARVGVGLVRGDPLVDLGYVYRGARPTLRLRLYRSVDAGGGYRIGSRNPTWAAERIGGESELSIGFPSRFDTHVLSMTYDAQWVRAFGGLPELARNIDPSSPGAGVSFRGLARGAALHLELVERAALRLLHQQPAGRLGLRVGARARRPHRQQRRRHRGLRGGVGIHPHALGTGPPKAHPRAARRRGHWHQRPRRAWRLRHRGLSPLLRTELDRRLPLWRAGGRRRAPGISPLRARREPVSARQRGVPLPHLADAARGLHAADLPAAHLRGRLRRRGQRELRPLRPERRPGGRRGRAADRHRGGLHHPVLRAHRVRAGLHGRRG
ncbi:MAG: PD40 domain-containing protein [Deltaproteobacteria bacterium]|nr:PD40 domain-containing protein [Deltaproteobacteria bacterium]